MSSYADAGVFNLMTRTSKRATKAETQAAAHPHPSTNAESSYSFVPNLPLGVMLVTVAALSFIANINTMQNDFVFDDDRAVVKNPDVISPVFSFADLLRHDFWG